MALYNNVPTFTYIHATGISVLWNNELYMVQDFSTNLKYVYWNADLPNQLNASNVMPNRSSKQHLVLINDNGIATEVPPTTENFSINYDGNSVQAIKNRIYGLYEKNEQFGDKFIAIEEDIDGLRKIVGSGGTGGTGYDDTAIWEKISEIEQTAENIDLSVKETVKTYNDDKEINKLREDLNSSIIKINSTLGAFKSELTGYFKDNEISDDEKIQIETHLEQLENDKASVDGNVDKVILIAENNNQAQDAIALNSVKQALQNAHDNLKNNVTNAIIDQIITSTENTIITDAFAKYSLRINEIKQTCDDIILLGLGGTLIEELGKISVKSDEIRLSVSSVESSFKSEMSVQKIELEKQIGDVSQALGTFEETVNTVFKDGVISEAEKSLLAEKMANVDKEKLDIDTRYNSIYNDANLSTSLKEDLSTKYSQYNTKHDNLKNKIEHVISDDLVNDAEKLEIDTLFKQYSNALASISAILSKAIEDIAFNTSQEELKKAKEELQDEIDDVKDSIENIGDIIDGTFQDNVLDEVERKDIQQNLDNLTREKIDIDNTYDNMYSSEYLYGQDKENFKLAYDNYVDAYNEVFEVSTSILNKETLIDDIDRSNLDSAILNHKDKLNLLSIETKLAMDVIALNKSNALKGDIQQEISDVNDRIDDVLEDISGAVGDGIIDKAEAVVIKESLENIQKERMDVEAKYNIIYANSYLDGEVKTNLETAKNEFDEATWDLIEVVTAIIDDDKVTDSEKESLENARYDYKQVSATLNTRFQEAIDYIAKKQVDEAKENFQKEIEDLGEVITDLEETMGGAFQDGILTEAEKQSVKQHLLTLSSEKSDIDKQYTTLYANTYLDGDAKTKLKTAYDSYVTAYNSLVTVINNMLNKNGIIDDTDRSKLDNAFKTHDTKLGLYTESATNALDYIAKKKVDESEEKTNSKIAEIIINADGITQRVESVESTTTTLVDKVDSVTTTANSNKTEITTTKNKLATVETSLEGITSRVSSVETTTTELNGQITGIDSRLETAEQKITDEAITSTVSSKFASKEDLKKAGYGTINYIRYTDFSRENALDGWKYSNTSATTLTTNAYGNFGNNLDIDSFIKGKKALRHRINIEKTIELGSKYGLFYPLNISLEKNTTYTLSLWLYLSGNTDKAYVRAYNILEDGTYGTNLGDVTVTKYKGAFEKVTLTFTTTSESNTVGLRFYNYFKSTLTTGNADVHIYNPMLVKGELEKDWSPAIEDIIDDIDVSKESVSKIEQKTESIELSVSKKVDSDTIISSINMSPETIKINASKVTITGFVTFSDLSTKGSTTIHGANIQTGTITANHITSVDGATINGEINGLGGIRFSEGAVMSSVPSQVAGVNGIKISAPSIELGSYVNMWHPTVYGDIGGKSSNSSTTTSWSISGSGAISCSSITVSGSITNTSGTIYGRRIEVTNDVVVKGTTYLGNTNFTVNTSGVMTCKGATISGSATVSSNLTVSGVIYGVNRIALARGSVYIPNFAGNGTYDYFRFGENYIVGSDTGGIHLIYSGSSNATFSRGSLYVGSSGTITADYLRLGGSLMVSNVSNNEVYFTNSGGSYVKLHASNYSTTYNLDSVATLSEESVFDEINAVGVVSTEDGLKLVKNSSSYNFDSSGVITTTYDEEEEKEYTSVEHLGAISTLWKAVQELKQENEELKKLINSKII